jgi:hypothetical protein
MAANSETPPKGKIQSNTLNFSAFKEEFTKYNRAINDIYIETQVCIKGLSLLKEEVDKLIVGKQTHYRVRAPSRLNVSRTIRREIGSILGIIDERQSSKEFVQSLVFAIARTESYISASLLLMIRAYPAKLLLSTKGNEPEQGQSPKVDLRELIEASSIDSLVAERAVQRIREAMYAEPKQYIQYCSKILGFSLTEDICRQFSEIKATRDIYVHGDGRANSIYTRKAGPKRRVNVGELLPVNGDYLSESVVCMKVLMSEIHRGLQWKYGASVVVQRVLAS